MYDFKKKRKKKIKDRQVNIKKLKLLRFEIVQTVVICYKFPFYCVLK